MSRRRRHNPFAKRAPVDWGGRIVLALGLVVGGYMGLTASAANVVVKVDPARAHLLAPGNGVITADYAQTLFTRNPTADDDAPSVRLARKALRQDPTTVEALTVLGLQAQLQNDAARTGRIFTYSNLLSRRELRPKIWAIEDAVTRGDIAEALRQYDLALRTSPDAQSLLFPTLTAALVEPQIRARLLRILATRPIWEESFIRYAASSRINPEGVLKFFAEGRQAGVVVPSDQRAALINALFAAGKTDLAWKAYARIRPNARRDRSRDPNFALAADARTIFDWQAGYDPSMSAAILKTGDGKGLLDFAVPPSTGGVLVHQTELLAPGAYRLTGQSVGIDQPEQSQPYWVLTCQMNGRELGRIRVSNSALNNGRFAGHFSVPENCTVQTLSLVAVPSDDISGVSGQIVRAELVPTE
ncbi:MAG: hypothetical protein CMN72_12095 [Sphingomonas sp.]|nr:hypothetical protein [Sphingomonas sp.]|tara:strand:+ start:1248 stop:2492 length:1245 start_codon:yes stop_codon:yes gene_type:complete